MAKRKVGDDGIEAHKKARLMIDELGSGANKYRTWDLKRVAWYKRLRFKSSSLVLQHSVSSRLSIISNSNPLHLKMIRHENFKVSG